MFGLLFGVLGQYLCMYVYFNNLVAFPLSGVYRELNHLCWSLIHLKENHQHFMC